MSILRVHAIADEALGNTSYVVDVGDGCALVVDPRRDIDGYLAVAEQARLRVIGVFETHLHADFVGGARELAAVTGAATYAAAEASLGFPHIALQPGNEIHMSSAVIEVLATPGHTPEHLAFVARAGDRAALFSGGSLIVGGAARTDLSGPERTEELARAQFASMRALAALPDDAILYPTHGAGSFCSTGASRARTSTIGEERARNPLLAEHDEDAFVRLLVGGFGSYPRYFANLRALNQTGPRLVGELDPVRQIAPEEAVGAVDRGAWLVDGRDWTGWARAHAAGSISIEVRPAFASWLGWVVPFGAPVVLMLEPEQLDVAVVLARRVGYDRVEGWLTFEAWRDAGLPVASLATVTPVEARAKDAVLLDVRQKHEFDAGHIPGAMHIELGDIIAGKTPDAGDVVTYCGHGERSATAASLLARRGVRAANLLGGTAAWRAAGLPYD
jgi:glyoxylase-like metal-dependent hydrolase (beta-lactamase superfamily II)/rhodanese-related sulfurtransferase